MKQTETLIIGQGIAGSLVAFMLHQQGIPFLVMDPGHTNTASRVAAGMFTPITGKRKTINADTLLQISFAINIYKQIEKLLDKTILHIQDIYYLPATLEEQNNFSKKISKDNFAKYVITDPSSLHYLKQDFQAFEITNSGWVDCGLFINSFKDWLKQKNALIEQAFKYEQLEITHGAMQYKGIKFKKVIFCEGYKVFNNPFFNDEDIIPCKGDVLTVEYQDTGYNHIIKKNSCYLVPLGNNKFKAGSTYKWHNSNESLDETGKNEIKGQLDQMLTGDYTVIEHQSAIRSTTQNREVIAKQHSEYPGIFMLNGLGTKGIIQGPYWASYITGLIKKYL